ncbi:uncharacterized protein RAG0_09527 [Rhynchosporium agropyri]|uniref:DUF7730 domain-containing protein n=1 Tax=Rhynchosporium agropyri TaxID=914238 RepID=A0A1E1KVX2_9HELO|nr:uncharacterized protein RAG0_09527 [Rhynchosporium agropyri]
MVLCGLRSWLLSFIDFNPCGTQTPTDCCDYDLPPSRLIQDRLPITRPSTPYSSPAVKQRSVVSFPEHFPAARISVKTPLLELVPLEIRRKIWTLVAGGQTHQLGDLRAGLRGLGNGLHCVCPERRTCDKGCQADITEWYLNKNRSRRPPLTRHTRNDMCLLKLCRQVYTEAIYIIYSINTFEITHAQQMECLPLSILHQRMNTIRTLRLTCDFSGTPPIRAEMYSQYYKILHDRYKKWQNIWRILSEMASLRRLHFNLNVDWD